jgi:hypothetical protein
MFTGFFRLGPILVCERGAKLRNLDLEVAAADAKYWWETGRVPLRATPIISTESRIFKGKSAQEANEAAKAETPKDHIISLCEICTKHRDSTKSHTIYTSRVMFETTRKTANWQYTKTTTFGEFESHHCEVCRSCFITRTFALPLAVFALSLLFFLTLFQFREFPIALFFAVFPAGFALWKLGVSSTLIRIAVSSRKRGKPGDYKGYTERSYEALPFRAAARKETLARESARAGAEMLASGERCWFCGQNRPADGTPYNVTLTKEEEGGKQEKNVWVPLCTACEAGRLAQQRKLKTQSMVLSLASIGLGVLAGVLTGDALEGWSVLVGFVVFLSVAAAGIAVMSLTRMRKGKEFEIKAAALIEHPQVKALLRAGWRMDAARTGTAGQQ